MCEVIPEETRSDYSKDLEGDKDSAPLLVSSPMNFKIPVPEAPVRKTSNHWVRKSTSTPETWKLFEFLRLFLPSVATVLASGSCWATLWWLWSTPWPVCSPGCWSSRYLWRRWTLACCTPSCSWHRRTSMCANWKRYNSKDPGCLHQIPQKQLKNWPPLFQIRCESRVLLCCYRAVNVHYYKYTVHGINIFALSILSFLRSWINLENVSSIGQNISFSPFPLSLWSLQTSCRW